MTTTQTQLRRDTAANIALVTPAAGEPFYDTTNKRLGVGDGATAGGVPHPSAADVQGQSFLYAAVGGTGNAITLTNTPPVGSLVNGLKQVFKATANNTSSVTVAVDGLTAKAVKKMNLGALASLASGDIVSGGIYEIYYDGTQFQIKALAEGPFRSGALFYLGTATASSSATIDLTSLLSATYDDYLIVLDNVLAATIDASLNMRCSTDNSTFDSGANYWYSVNGNDSGGNTVAVNGQSQTSFVLTDAALKTTYGISGSIILTNVNSTSVPRFYSGTLSYHYRIGASNHIAVVAIGGAWVDTSHTLEAVRFFMSSGNITSGTFKVYGIVKS